MKIFKRTSNFLSLQCFITMWSGDNLFGWYSRNSLWWVCVIGSLHITLMQYRLHVTQAWNCINRQDFSPFKCQHLILGGNFKCVNIFESLLLHPGFFSCWSVSCTGCHGSLPVVLICVKTGDITSRTAGCSGRLRLDHYVGSWKTHTQTNIERQ